MYDKEFLASGAGIPHVADKARDFEQSHLWGENHQQIMSFIKKYVQEMEHFPSVALIARGTGLSRPTIYKHLREFPSSPDFTEYASMFKLMIVQAMWQICRLALEGNITAARMYLEIMGVLNTGKSGNVNFFNPPKNHLKVNNTAITEEILNNLNHEQKCRIENILLESINETN